MNQRIPVSDATQVLSTSRLVVWCPRRTTGILVESRYDSTLVDLVSADPLALTSTASMSSAGDPPCDKYPPAKQARCAEIWKELNKEDGPIIAQFGLDQQKRREEGKINAQQHLAEIISPLSNNRPTSGSSVLMTVWPRNSAPAVENVDCVVLASLRGAHPLAPVHRRDAHYSSRRDLASPSRTTFLTAVQNISLCYNSSPFLFQDSSRPFPASPAPR